ncbi:MAG TPA: class I SAM-dependent methyltransferase [Opitutaceae bacterium]
MSEFPNFFGAPPSPQNALDLFKGEWSTGMPAESGLSTGRCPLRLDSDYRIDWCERTLGGFAGKRILELGPLEGGHTYLLEKRGAAEIVAIEASARAFLKCLVIKETFALQHARFLLGDFMPYLRADGKPFDIGIACGVLYHLLNPMELVALLARRCESLFLWTHYYEASAMVGRPHLEPYFVPEPAHQVVEGFPHRLYMKRYGEAVQWKGFCGGAGTEACWMPLEDLLRGVEHFGFRILDHVIEKTPNGPAAMIAARKA